MGWISHVGLGYGGYCLLSINLHDLRISLDRQKNSGPLIYGPGVRGKTDYTTEMKRRNPAPFLPGQGFDRSSAAAAGSGATPPRRPPAGMGWISHVGWGYGGYFAIIPLSLFALSLPTDIRTPGLKSMGPEFGGKRTIQQK